MLSSPTTIFVYCAEVAAGKGARCMASQQLPTNLKNLRQCSKLLMLQDLESIPASSRNSFHSPVTPRVLVSWPSSVCRSAGGTRMFCMCLPAKIDFQTLLNSVKREKQSSFKCQNQSIFVARIPGFLLLFFFTFCLLLFNS